MNATDPHRGSHFDAAALLASMHGDQGAVAEMLRLCLEIDAPRFLSALRTARERNDLPGLQAAAHGIKGLTGELCAHASHRLASRLEEAAGDPRAQWPAELVTELEEEFVRLCEALRGNR